jgi:hypothetical protein
MNIDSRKISNNFFKFQEDHNTRKMAIHLLVSDPLERTFTDELFNVNLAYGMPTNREIYMKIAHIWSTYDQVTRLAYC